MNKFYLLIYLFLQISSNALANPFDSFIGEYKISTKPEIIKNAKWCNRFNFREILGLKIEANTQGYAQSHVIYVIVPDGWSGHPTMEYNWSNESQTGGSFAKTTGSSSIASNEWGSWRSNPQEWESLIVSIEKIGSGYKFSMFESLKENNILTASCGYQVGLVKKQ